VVLHSDRVLYADGFEQSCQFQPMPSHVGQVEALLQPPEAEATRNANAGRLRYARIVALGGTAYQPPSGQRIVVPSDDDIDPNAVGGGGLLGTF
jgi:hypothetical protein